MRYIVAVAALSAACAGAALSAPLAGLPTVQVSGSALGTNILVSSKGLTLYHYVPEKKGTVKCTGACAVLFPPLVVPAGAKPIAGPGLVAAKLGTIKRPDGRLQVTYNGLTLYRDYYDRSGGQVNGQGQQAVWYAVTQAGTITKDRPIGKPSASTPTTGGQSAGAERANATQPDLAAGSASDPPPDNCVPGSSCEGG